MVEVFGDFGVKSWVEIFEYDILLRCAELLRVKGFVGTVGGLCVDIGPLIGRGAARK